MSDFFTAYLQTMGHEGQYSNDQRDRGGETWKGVARKMHPEWDGWLIVDMIKRSVITSDLSHILRDDEELEELVRAFYKAEFWDKLLLDQIKDQDIASEIFDTAVNQGLVKAVSYLQKSLNLLNNDQSHYSDINEDGKTGPATMRAYLAYMLTAHFPGRSTARNTRTLLKVMNALQFNKYISICEANQTQEAFFYGWVNRV
jgi:lysozyme family protein